MSLPLTIFLIVASHAYTDISCNLPSIETLPALLEPPSGIYLEPTRLYDHTGINTLFTLEHPLLEEHKYLHYSIDDSSEIPQIMVDALVANLDPQFWTHPGVRIWWPIDTQYPSLAQKIVLDLLLWEEPDSTQRDVRSALLAAQITEHYGREKVIEWYLNTAYFGNHLYGIHAASQVYFSKPAADLEIHEAAALASILQTPALNAFDAPNAVIEGQQAALEAMYEQGRISEEQALQALQTPLVFNENDHIELTFEHPFVQYVLSQLEPIIDPALIERGGFNIVTTLDIDIQSQVECTILAQNERYIDAVEDEVFSLSDCPAARLLPQAILENQNIETAPQTSVIVIEPESGKIRALVGNNSVWDASSISPNSGTLITPFIYLTAFTRGYTPSSLLWDIPNTNTVSTVDNLDGLYHGPMRARVAFANDYIAPTEMLLNTIGIQNVNRTLINFGLQTTQTELLPVGPKTTLLEIVHAYSSFVNGGRLIGRERTENGSTNISPIAVENVIDESGFPWLDNSSAQEVPVITPQLAYLVTDMLQDESVRWPTLGHPNKLEIGRPTAAKMGVVPGEAYGWTVGYSYPYLVGVWTGTPQPETEIDIDLSMDYADAAASVWHAIQRYTLQDEPIRSWEIPVGINNRNVCDPSGLLPTQACPNTVNEVFIAGTEPTQPDHLYQSFRINRETGRLATVFTPPELVDEQVYLVAPPEAQDWAIANEIPIPPETSDIIFRPTVNPDVMIESPEMFDYVVGETAIRGTASGDQFLSYRVQIGAGLNPQSWVQIESDKTTPVENNILTHWDTQGYSGLYAVQLVVLRGDQTVETSTIQVTVDNDSPELSILYPADGAVIQYQSGESMTFLAEAADNIAVDRIEFYLGERLLGEATQAPYAATWRMSPGDYSVTLIAYDLAGNQAESSATFQVDR